MDTRQLAQNLYDTYSSIIDELGYDNWSELCEGEGLTTLEKQINWFTEDIDPSMEGHISNDESYLIAGELSCLFGQDDRFDGLAGEITDAIAIAYIDTAWDKEVKIASLREGYNAQEDKDKISFAKYVSLRRESDPGFDRWLFDGNRALVDGDGHLTAKGKEKYADFLSGLTN